MHEGFCVEVKGGVSQTEREANVDNVFPPKMVAIHNRVNYAINFIVCIVSLYIFDFQVFANWNIVKLGIIYVLTDIVLGFIDNYIVYLRPINQNRKLTDISKREKYVKYLEDKFAEVSKEYEAFKDGNCNRCRHGYYRSHTGTYHCTESFKEKCLISKEYTWWQQELAYHKQALEKAVEEIEVKTAVENEKSSSEYQNKIEYFKDMKLKFEHLSNKIKGLKAISKSLGQLLKLLERKPIGLTFIPTTTYIYLDELQVVLSKYKGLDKEQKERYTEQINKIAEALSRNIEDLNRRIDNYETEDIEVSLNVLFSELVKDSEDEDNV